MKSSSFQTNAARLMFAALSTAGVFAVANLTGCTDPPPPPPPPVVYEAPAPPPPPELTSIAELMSKYDIDQRVNLPENLAPSTDVERIAVLKFFDAFARGNVETLKPMMVGPDQFQLDGLVESGAFAKNVAGITRIDVRCGSQEGNACSLAVFHVADGFQPQLWVYKAADDSAEFDAVATPPAIMEKLSGDNWIAAWYDILKLELAKANEPDEVVAVVQQDFTPEETEVASAGDSGAPAAAPAGPGKRAPGAPINAPRAPGFGNK